MTRTTLAVALAAGALLAGCGGDGEPAGSSTGPSPTMTEAAAPDGDGHGEHAEMPIGMPADASEAERTIEVAALDAMAFEPDAVEVAAGEVVTFVITNEGEAVHEFVLGDAAMQEEHAEEMGEMGSGMAHDEPNAVSVEPGGTAELTWRFGDAGTVEYACHEPGHFEAGMRGTITVGASARS